MQKRLEFDTFACERKGVDQKRKIKLKSWLADVDFACEMRMGENEAKLRRLINKNKNKNRKNKKLPSSLLYWWRVRERSFFSKNS